MDDQFYPPSRSGISLVELWDKYRLEEKEMVNTVGGRGKIFLFVTELSV